MEASDGLTVIGAGPASQAAAELAVHFGRRVIIVERNRPGGTVTTARGDSTKTPHDAALSLTRFSQKSVGLRTDQAGRAPRREAGPGRGVRGGAALTSLGARPCPGS